MFEVEDDQPIVQWTNIVDKLVQPPIEVFQCLDEGVRSPIVALFPSLTQRKINARHIQVDESAFSSMEGKITSSTIFIVI
jgi:hypothetical protein